MPRGAGRNHYEKPKDFGKSLKTLLSEIFHYKAFMITAIIMSVISCILVIRAPGQLTNLINTISDGLVINKDNMQQIGENITSNLKSDYVQENIQKALEMDLTSENIASIMQDTAIDQEDKTQFQEILSQLSNANVRFSKESLSLIKQIPTSILEKLFVPTTIDGVEITVVDRLQLINVLENINFEDFEQSTENLDEQSNDETVMNQVNSMAIDFTIPEDLYPVFFKEFTIDGVTLTPKDQYEFITKISGVTNSENSTQIYEVLDQMPEDVYNLIKPNMDMDTVKKIAIFLALMYAISAIANYVSQILTVEVSNRFAKDLRNRVICKINKLPLSFFDKHQTGDILSIETNDVDTIAQNLNNSLSTLLSSVTLLIGSLIMMFVTNVQLALTAIVASIVGILISGILVSRSQKYFILRQKELGELNSHIEEIYSNINVVKSYNGRQKAREEFDELNKRVRDANQKSQFISGINQPLMAFIGNFGYVAVCIVGSILAMNNIITFGVIVAFITYVRLFTQPLSQIAQSITQLQSVGAAGERVFNLLEEKNMPEVAAKNVIPRDKVQGKVDFEDVVFTYDGNDKPTIKGFSANAKPKQKIAIVGPTGAGKTTLVNLLMKFYDIDSGKIKIDDVNIEDLSRSNVHDLFTMVLQDTWIFDGTVMENIKYNMPNVTDEQVKQVCKEIGLDHFINTLPKGYDTVLNENDSISVGQKQLLTIARGMVENAPILILDEATSNVDTRTEELVQDAMDKLSEGKTSFIIAHRLSTIKNADLILVVNEGNIVEQGTHEQLLEKDGFYAKLYNSQFEKNSREIIE